MNVSSELNYIINSLSRVAGSQNTAYSGMNITQKINLIYKLSRVFNFPTTTTSVFKYNLNSELDNAIYNMVAVAGSIGPYHSLSINQKINYAYRMARRIDNMAVGTTTTSTSTTSTTTSGGDVDANAWIAQLAANGATQDATHQGYIQTLITGLKTDSNWTRIYALYIPIFGSANANKWNVKNSIDADGSFRITFTGSWNFANSKMTGDGATTIADTHFNTSTNATVNALGLGTYSYAGGTSYLIGNDDSTHFTFIQANTVSLFGSLNSGTLITGSATTPTRLLYYNRGNSTQIKVYRDGTLLTTYANNSTAPPNMTVYLGGLNFNGGTQFGALGSACYLITDGSLLDTDVTNLTNRINTFMTSWGINV